MLFFQPRRCLLSSFTSGWSNGSVHGSLWSRFWMSYSYICISKFSNTKIIFGYKRWCIIYYVQHIEVLFLFEFCLPKAMGLLRLNALRGTLPSHWRVVDQLLVGVGGLLMLTEDSLFSFRFSHIRIPSVNHISGWVLLIFKDLLFFITQGSSVPTCSNFGSASWFQIDP